MAAREEAPPTKPSEDEAAVLAALTRLDRSILDRAPHLEQTPGAGLLAVLSHYIERSTGVTP